jgi:flavin reductase (DIM6/NTAB) family NADH-FMN oxidoreductase RutF
MSGSDRDAGIGIGEFWRALGARAIGGAVVAAADAQGPAGFLALSATHLSASPPMLMVSVGRRTSALATLLGSGSFAISYLGEGDRALADSFAGKGELKGAARFTAGRWTTLRTGSPVLVGAVGALDCVLEETIERHDTIIALGRLVAYAGNAGGVRPLVSFAGGWTTLGPAS